MSLLRIAEVTIGIWLLAYVGLLGYLLGHAVATRHWQWRYEETREFLDLVLDEEFDRLREPAP